MEHIPVLAKKQSLSEAVERNASDYFRMFDVKCSYWSKQMTPQCVAMVCLDLAARTAGVPFDKSRAHKLVGATKASYGTAHQVVEKTLELQSQFAVKDYAVQHGYPEVGDLAGDIVAQYKEVIKEKDVRSGSIDLGAAMYSLAAVYTACKHKKIRVDRKKFVSGAGVSQSLFQSILDVMQNCLPHPAHSEESKEDGVESKDTEQSEGKSSRKKSEPPQSSEGSTVKRYKRDDVLDKVLYSPLSEEFVQWKEETIREARKALALSPMS